MYSFSLPFLYGFLPVFLILYLLLPARGRNGLLAVGSLLLYGWVQGGWLLLLVAVVVVTWLFGLLVERFRRAAKGFLAVYLTAAFGLLATMKWLEPLFRSLRRDLGLPLPLVELALPLGLGICLMQGMAYVTGVYRGEGPAKKEPVTLVIFLAGFPWQMAGPLLSWKDFAPQSARHPLTLSRSARGVRRMAVGLGKTVVLAGTLALFPPIFAASQNRGVLFCWLYGLIVLLWLYYEVSGMMDLAVGLGELLGFQMPEVFARPLSAGSLTGFWRRTLIPVGKWFYRFVYLPLRGRKGGKVRQALALTAAWVLVGLWWSPGWNLVIFGLINGLLVVLERFWLGPFLGRHPVVARLGLWVVLCVQAVLLTGPDLAAAGEVLGGMIGCSAAQGIPAETAYYSASFFVVLALGVVGATPLPALLWGKLSASPRGRTVAAVLEPVLVLGLLLVSTGYLVDGGGGSLLRYGW